MWQFLHHILKEFFCIFCQMFFFPSCWQFCKMHRQRDIPSSVIAAWENCICAICVVWTEGVKRQHIHLFFLSLSLSFWCLGLWKPLNKQVFVYGFAVGLTSPKGCKQARYLKTLVKGSALFQANLSGMLWQPSGEIQVANSLNSKVASVLLEHFGYRLVL